MNARQWKILICFVGIFVIAYCLPLSDAKVTTAIIEA